MSMNPETKIVHQRMSVLELAETLGNAYATGLNLILTTAKEPT